jgi:hypothetical protein
MKAILKCSILPALLLGLVSVAFADTVQLGSYGTNSSPQGNANSAMVYRGYSLLPLGPFFNFGPSTTYDIPATSPWVGPIANSSWVSNYPNSNPNGGTDPANGFYEFTSTFTANGGMNGAHGAYYDGVIDLLADDTLAVWIDGQLIANFAGGPNSTCQTNMPNCTQIDAVLVTNLWLWDGTNCITVIDDQSNGASAGFDFGGDLTKTPEPSSLLLLGSGLLGFALVLFRKSKSSGLISHS